MSRDPRNLLKEVWQDAVGDKKLFIQMGETDSSEILKECEVLSWGQGAKHPAQHKRSKDRLKQITEG